MAGGVEQRDQAQKSEERAAEQVRLVFFRAVVGTTFFTDDEKGDVYKRQVTRSIWMLLRMEMEEN